MEKNDSDELSEDVVDREQGSTGSGQQSSDVGVTNFYEAIPVDEEEERRKNPNLHVHGIKIPFRMLLVGASGSMKTNSALDIIEKFSGTFDHITVVCRNADEPLYNLLKKNVPKNQITLIEIVGDDLSKLPKLSDMNKNSPQTLVIFDDLVLVKNQRPIVEFFIRARKLNCSCMYLTQGYFNSPKPIRSNCNYILLKKISSKRDLQLILSEYSLQVTLQELSAMYAECTRDKLDWFLIALENPPEKRFFHNYTLMNGHRGTTNDGNGSHAHAAQHLAEKKPKRVAFEMSHRDDDRDTRTSASEASDEKCAIGTGFTGTARVDKDTQNDADAQKLIDYVMKRLACSREKVVPEPPKVEFYKRHKYMKYRR